MASVGAKQPELPKAAHLARLKTPRSTHLIFAILFTILCVRRTLTLNSEHSSQLSREYLTKTFLMQIELFFFSLFFLFKATSYFSMEKEVSLSCWMHLDMLYFCIWHQRKRAHGYTLTTSALLLGTGPPTCRPKFWGSDTDSVRSSSGNLLFNTVG